MLKKPMVHLVLAIFLTAYCAVSSASDTTQLCLGIEAATQAEASNAVICGFPMPGNSTADVPVACSRRASGVFKLLQACREAEAGIQDASKICFMSIKPDGQDITILPVGLIQLNYPDVPLTRRIRLLDSVAEIVGISKGFAIRGPISSINPAVFADVGLAQKAKLKYLFLVETDLQSLDLALIEPLNIMDLILVRNSKLTRVVNYKNAPLSTLKVFVSWNNNQSLVDCRNLLGLPNSINKLVILQTGLKDNCAQCHLPKSCSQLFVKQDEPDLKYIPNVNTRDVYLPYPLDSPYGMPSFFPDVVPYKILDINTTMPISRSCETECNCNKWPQPVDSTKNNAALDAGTGSSASVINSGNSGTGGSASVINSGTSGTGKEREATNDGSSTCRLSTSTALAFVALALFRVSGHL